MPVNNAREYLRKCSKVLTLKDPNGKKSTVGLFDNDASNSKSITNGWGPFLRYNDLEEGDVCVFEVINRKIIVLKVWMYRVADYAGQKATV